MKVLTKEEQARLIPSNRVVRKSSLRHTAFNLDKDDVLFVSKKDWKTFGYSKITTIGSLLWDREKKFTTAKVSLDDEHGWSVKRRR
jgi:hypothetical protein